MRGRLVIMAAAHCRAAASVFPTTSKRLHKSTMRQQQQHYKRTQLGKVFDPPL
jgi:hypothetical protein